KKRGLRYRSPLFLYSLFGLESEPVFHGLFLFFSLIELIMILIAVDRHLQSGFRQIKIALRILKGFVGINFLREECIYRQCGMGTLAQGSRTETDGAVFCTGPYARYQIGSDTNKPGIGVVVGGSGFSTHRVFKVEHPAQTMTASFIDHTF